MDSLWTTTSADLATTSQPEQPPVEDATQHSALNIALINRVTSILYKQLGYIILALGILGNILCLMVFYRRKIRSLKVTIFLRVLAFVDLFFIVIGHGLYPEGPPGFQVVNQYRAICKLYYFITPSLLWTSTWLVTGFTFERCMAITKPLKLKTSQAFGHRVIYGYIVAVVVLAMTYQVHALVLFDIVYKPRGDGTMHFECEPVTQRAPLFIKFIRPWITILVRTFIPFSIILVCNFCILRELRFSQKFKAEAMTLSQKSSKVKAKDGGPGPKDANKQEAKKLLSIAVMLMTVGFVFLGLSLPLGLAQFLTRLLPPSFWWGSPQQAALSNFMWGFALSSLYMNSAINFILYIVSGRTFRDEMICMLKEFCPCGSSDQSSANNKSAVTEESSFSFKTSQ